MNISDLVRFDGRCLTSSEPSPKLINYRFHLGCLSNGLGCSFDRMNAVLRILLQSIPEEWKIWNFCFIRRLK